LNENNNNEEKKEEEIDLSTSPADSEKYEEIKEEVSKAEKDEKKKKASFIFGVYDWLETFCLALALMVMLFLFAFKYVIVDGTSMLNTLENAQKLVITDLTDYKQGDIVVICRPGNEKPLVKRIIAKGGQTVRIDFETWTVYVDGVALDEPYVRRIPGEAMKADGFSGTITVDEGCVFVMGDNRNGSSDSRRIGCIDERNILGKVVCRIFPLDQFGTVD
jgi:signal peptidase I